MTPAESIALVGRYYDSFRSDSADVTAALSAVLASEFRLESPLVAERFGGPVTGEQALAVAASVSAFLRNAHIEAVYSAEDGTGVAALIVFPSPVGTVVQFEHFDIDTETGKITRLRSFYDPRKLLAGS